MNDAGPPETAVTPRSAAPDGGRTGGSGTRRPVTADSVRSHPLIAALIRASNEHLAAQGFTEHGHRHAQLVSKVSYNVMTHLGRGGREAELAEIAGYTHDIGNAVARQAHGQIGAALLTPVLLELGMDPYEVTRVAGAVGNHEEEVGQPVNPVSAALILADKSDVHRSRVQSPDVSRFDIHDRVNYAVERSFLRVEASARTITLELSIDTSILPIMEYFEIFLSRMLMCRRAAEFLGCSFRLDMNGVRLL